MKIFEYLRLVIFANSAGSRNSQNKGHIKNMCFTFLRYSGIGSGAELAVCM